jgi:hypothetical protein
VKPAFVLFQVPGHLEAMTLQKYFFIENDFKTAILRSPLFIQTIPAKNGEDRQGRFQNTGF